jgi:hypothetical protein
METIIAAIIGGIFAALGSVSGALLSRNKDKSNIKSGKAKEISESSSATYQVSFDNSEAEELAALWKQFLAECSDDRLEFYLSRVNWFISQYPENAEGTILKALLLKALEAKDKRRLIGPPPRHPIHILLASKFYSWLKSVPDRRGFSKAIVEIVCA